MQVPPKLGAGYERFRSHRFPSEEQRYRDLALGQKPHTMVISCADSRVDPATIFSAAPGELFVVRNVAAIVPPYEENGDYHGTSAALEFAVTVLGVRNIVVMGHGLCGGVAAALASNDQRPAGRFIGPWVKLLDEVRDEVCREFGPNESDQRQRALEHRAIRYSIANLETFPFIADALSQGHVKLYGAWFSIAEGVLDWLDPGSNTFERVPE